MEVLITYRTETVPKQGRLRILANEYFNWLNGLPDTSPNLTAFVRSMAYHHDYVYVRAEDGQTELIPFAYITQAERV